MYSLQGPDESLMRELLEVRQRLLAPLAERRERGVHVVLQILALLGPPVGGGRHEPQVVHRGDLLEARHEELLGVAQVADHFLRRPVLRVGTAFEDGLALTADDGRQLVGGALESLQA